MIRPELISILTSQEYSNKRHRKYCNFDAAFYTHGVKIDPDELTVGIDEPSKYWH